MSCDEVRAAVAVYLDGELDPPTSLALEWHLRACDACAGIVAQERALRGAFADGGLRFEPPATLDARVRSALVARAGSAGARRSIPSWLGIAAAFVIGVAVMAAVSSIGRTPLGVSRLRAEIVAGHLRSLQGRHLTDVLSSNQHTVRPWFAGKLPFSPTVPDLAAEGFPLVGGRLDVLDGRAAAALVYNRRLHVINVFTRPADSGDSSERSLGSDAGYHVVAWTRAGMAFWAVSDVDPAELERFARFFDSAAR